VPDRSEKLARLEAAISGLALHLSKLDVDVHVPLYANTFPLATVAKRAAQANPRPRVSINPFDWNWSKDPSNAPPFLSARPAQLFFATESEFARIHEAGISFFAIPTSVFHPRFVFIGLPRGASVDDPKYDLVAQLIEKTLSSHTGPEWDSSLAEMPITWVSDIPEQAELLASRVNEQLGDPEDAADRQLIKYWQDRPLADALGLLHSNESQGSGLKAFIWGGPLASVARRDTAQPGGEVARRTGGLKLRDPDLAQRCISLTSLTAAFSIADIRQRHALYCCIGYKEGRKLVDYYRSDQHLTDARWSISSRKFEALRLTPLPALVSAIKEFFGALFPAAAEVADAFRGAATPDEVDAGPFSEFVRDYDKFCRTVNPIAQLYTPGVYAACLEEHHDGEAFDVLFS